jgi:hypothetical protein
MNLKGDLREHDGLQGRFKGSLRDAKKALMVGLK